MSRDIFILLALALLLTGCSINPNGEKTVTTALSRAKSGPVVRAANSARARHGGDNSSVLLLEDNREALEWRLALADSAVSSIDCQYFLWNNDHAGRLLLSRLLQAADRGVRVRILVDDFLLDTKDRDIAALSHHPNLEIRIFNPERLRKTFVGGTTEFILFFSEMNRRMHNKTFTVDNAMTIVGGRNVGDHYYGLDAKYNFRDLDTLIAGPVVREVSSGFDRFWNAAESTPSEWLAASVTERDLEPARRKYADIINSEADGALRLFPHAARSWSREFARLPSRMVPGKARFLQDTPEAAEDDRILVRTLFSPEQGPQRELVAATPYLIPLESGMNLLRSWRSAGVEVKVIVPTLAAGNHTAAHSHYKKYRRDILKTGARLYEYRHDPSESSRALADTPPVRGEFVSFHLKALVLDRRQCFIGSLNLDPRAVEINTESGLLIDSPALAKQLLRILDELITPENAWELTLDENDRLLWTSADGTLRRPPARSGTQRATDFFLRLLPVEGQL